MGDLCGLEGINAKTSTSSVERSEAAKEAKKKFSQQMDLAQLAATKEEHREAATSAKTDAKKKLSVPISEIRGENH